MASKAHDLFVIEIVTFQICNSSGSQGVIGVPPLGILTVHICLKQSYLTCVPFFHSNKFLIPSSGNLSNFSVCQRLSDLGDNTSKPEIIS